MADAYLHELCGVGYVDADQLSGDGGDLVHRISTSGLDFYIGTSFGFNITNLERNMKMVC
jgi:hypothetical protein